MAIVLWFAALIGLVVATAIAANRERATPGAFVRRGVLASAVIAYAGMIVTAIWMWGGADASAGRAARLAEGAPVSLTVRDVRVPLAPTAKPRAITIGHVATAGVIVPGRGPAELARIELATQEGALVPAATVRLGPPVPATAPEDTAVALLAIASDTELASVRRERACTATSAALRIEPGTRVLVVECGGGVPLRALAIARDERGLAITPLAWKGAFVVARLGVRAGDALRVGAADPLPGVTTWEIPAPAGTMAMLAVPADPTACATWSLDPAKATARGGACVVDAGAFTVEARPLVPDADAVVDRGARAALVVGAPGLLLLLALTLAPRRQRRAALLGRALRIAVLGAGLTALACWRLAWAYRIDMLRALDAQGERLAANLVGVVGIGAALAGCAAAVFAGRTIVAIPGERAIGEVRASHGAQLVTALVAWGAWLAVAWLVVDPAAGADLGRLVPGTVVLSAVGAVLPVALAIAQHHASSRRDAFAPELALTGIAVASIVARAASPGTTLVKLALAYGLVLAGHAALRVAAGPGTPAKRRVWLVGLLVGATLALAGYDAGVAVAIAGTGLALAMLVAGHDATYDASQTKQLGLLEREHARLLLVHAVAVIGVTIALVAAVIGAGDRALVVDGPLAVLQAPLVAALLFGLGALVARSHRRAWMPWLAAALAALAIWGARDRIALHVTGGDAVSSRRVAALVDPGYALLSDERSFASNVSAWREAALPPGESHGVWSGPGAFGARIRDPGVLRSIDNDYLPVLVAREHGVGGLARGLALLLVLVVGAGTIVTTRLSHGSREQRTRGLVLGVVGTLVVYQPLAALGVVPLTGISWPGLGIDSPADLWVFALGAIWCLGALGEGTTTEDERVRTTPRLVRAHRAVLAALALAGIAAVVVVIRAGVCAVTRSAAEDERIVRALDYAASLACPAETRGATLTEALPAHLSSAPTDLATQRFDAELAGAWSLARSQLAATTADQLAACRGARGGWQLARTDGGCRAQLALGWPQVRLELARDDGGIRTRCSIVRDERAIGVLRPPRREARPSRIRVVATALGVAATDQGELVAGARVVRLRPASPALALGALAEGVTPASRIEVATGVTLETGTPNVVLRGPAELFVAEDTRRDDSASWRRLVHGGEVALDRVTLVVAGPADQRIVAVFRPARVVDGKPVVESLLADDTQQLGDRARRVYPYGAALPELGWVNPYDLDRSVGLDGWIHAAQRPPAVDATPTACGTLAPPPIERTRVCAPSPLDGVVECRVTLQPELALALDQLADALLVTPQPLVASGKVKREPVTPVRAAYVALRGDTGELLAQGNQFAGRAPLAYAPRDAAAEAELVRLRDEHGESDRERVEWNQPIAVGSTLKPIFARAAERAFPGYTAALSLGAVTEGTGCKARRGKRVSPILGHCPPTSVSGQPQTADLHDFLARSPNWYQATLGLAGLALPDATMTAGELPISLVELVDSDLTAWPTERALRITDGQGTILGPRGLVLAGMRRTPLWTNVEQLLGRPLCTLGDRRSCERAAERRDLCATRALPIAKPSADLRYLVALGPDRIDPYADDRPGQTTIAVREYLQLLRGAGVHPIGSLPQLADAFNRVVFDPGTGASRLAASWFPAPVTGVTPTWSCAEGHGHIASVLGADGGLCGVLRAGGTAQAIGAELRGLPGVIVYGGKTGTIDSLAELARKPSACRAWNARHPAAQLACGTSTPDDSLFVIAFGVVTPAGTIPITLAIQLQRGGPSSAARATPAFVRAVAAYLRGAS